MSEEHPVKQPIVRIVVSKNSDGDDWDFHTVGKHGITRIEACIKSGEYSNIPYLRVWAGDSCVAEFCQHKIAGVYFGEGCKAP